MKKTPIPTFTPEQEVLLWSIRVDHSWDQSIAEILEHGVDWSYIKQTAIQHGIVPLLYKRLTKDMVSLVPSKEIKCLKQLFLENAANNLRMTQELFRVLDTLTEAGIEAIAFKGPVLAVQGYGDLSMRSFSDLDVLIRESDFDVTYKILLKNGFTPNYPIDSRTKKKLAIFKGQFAFSMRAINLDVHWQLNQTWVSVSWPLDSAWDNLSTISIYEQDIKTLSPELSVILICVHGVKHFWQELKWLADLTHIIFRYPDLSWETIFYNAETYGVKKMLSRGLLLSEEYCGIHYPLIVVDELKSVISKQSLKVDKNFFKFGWKQSFSLTNVSYVKTQERTKNKILYILYYIIDVFLLPNKHDFKIISLPEVFFPLYFFVRFIRLAIRSPMMIYSYIEKS
jgi:hypothetical protein